MTKSDINKLKATRSVALKNAKMLLDGGDMYPKQDDIAKANALIDTAVKIDALLRGVTHD